MPRRVGVVVWPDLDGIGTGDEQRRRRHSGHHWDRARKHQTARNNLRSNRIGIPRHLTVGLDQMVAGIDADDEVCGGRGSVKLGISIVVHGGLSGGVLRALADMLSTVTLSGSSCSGCNDDGDMAGGRGSSTTAVMDAGGLNNEDNEG